MRKGSPTCTRVHRVRTFTRSRTAAGIERTHAAGPIAGTGVGDVALIPVVNRRPGRRGQGRTARLAPQTPRRGLHQPEHPDELARDGPARLLRDVEGPQHGEVVEQRAAQLGLVAATAVARRVPEALHALLGAGEV